VSESSPKPVWHFHDRVQGIFRAPTAPGRPCSCSAACRAAPASAECALEIPASKGEANHSLQADRVLDFDPCVFIERKSRDDSYVSLVGKVSLIPVIPADRRVLVEASWPWPRNLRFGWTLGRVMMGSGSWPALVRRAILTIQPQVRLVPSDRMIVHRQRVHARILATRSLLEYLPGRFDSVNHNYHN